eukprot:3523446-Rhodomonas_salina.1
MANIASAISFPTNASDATVLPHPISLTLSLSLSLSLSFTLTPTLLLTPSHSLRSLARSRSLAHTGCPPSPPRLLCALPRRSAPCLPPFSLAPDACVAAAV